MRLLRFHLLLLCALAFSRHHSGAAESGAQLFESKIRPVLVKHCYECHSEAAEQRKGGLLLDRETGWLKGGDTENAVVPGEPNSSLLMKAIRYQDEDLQMPPKYQLDPTTIKLLESWIALGAPGPQDDMGQTEFSRLGDQDYLFDKARQHWAFQPIATNEPPLVDDQIWNRHPIDRFVYAKLQSEGIEPSPRALPRDLMRRLAFALSGLPPTPAEVSRFETRMAKEGPSIINANIKRLLAKPTFGEHFARLWLDVARYADTDSTYRADTKTPHYFPFAFTYRDYVIDAFNADKPYDQFIREQLAADRLGLKDDAPELAALGFLTIGPHRRNSDNSIDDWIDVTTRGLMGITVACARCHDHKFEPVPTADYYALHGVFASISRSDPLNEKAMPLLAASRSTAKQRADYEKKRKAIEDEIEGVGKRKARNNNRSLAEKIRDTKLAELLLFHEGAPARAMVVKESRRPVTPFVYVRGERGNRGESIPRRFLKILDPEQRAFRADGSGRLDLVDRIVDPHNPLTARVLVNRVWGYLMGSHLVKTPSDFGLQGSPPTHPELLDWLARDFINEGWSLKHLVLRIVSSRTWQQRSAQRDTAAALDPENRLLWRANRRHLAIESLRDSLLFTSGELDPRMNGHAGRLWGEDHSLRRSVYGYINRFNLDPTLRAFDFPSAMHSAAQRGESIVAPQALFTMNSPFVIDRAIGLTSTDGFTACETDEARIEYLFARICQRLPSKGERHQSKLFATRQARFYSDPKKPISSPWPLIAQALYMSNEFQYVD